LKDEGSLVSVKAVGEKAGRTTVAARLVLEKCSTTLSDRLGTDQLVADAMRDKFETLFGPLDQINNEMMTARASIQPGDHRKH
jgi:hypothetical protein